MKKKPNLIFIFADQMRAHVLSCYGNTNIQTPNFDAMAKAGVQFKNSISTWPVCTPFRGMLLSGLYPMRNGAITNDTSLNDDFPSIAHVYKENGYETGYIGKWHLESNRDPFVPQDRRQGFDYWAVNNCTHNYIDHFYCTDTPEEIHFKGYDSVIQTDLAIDYIKNNKENPFCLFLSWGPPHDPYLKVPQEYKDRVNVDKINFRDNVNERELVDELLSVDNPPDNILEARERRRSVLEDDNRLKNEILHGYYAHTLALDDCIGKIRTEIKNAGIAEDTILVFTSDHGDMLGSHRMSLKQCPLEESINVPFLMEYPRKIAKESVTDELISPIDIMPTLISLSDLDCPSVDGKDISKAALGEKADFQDAVLIMKMTGGTGGGPYIANAMTAWRGVRTKQYTYANRLNKGPWMLYDNLKDPYQMNNLIENPDYNNLSKQLEKRMRELMEEAGDSGNTEQIMDVLKSKSKNWPG